MVICYGGFIAKLDPDGNVIWVEHISGPLPPSVTITAMCTDQNGGLFLTGTSYTHSTFSGMKWDDWDDQYNLASTFVTKYNTEGEPQWVEFATVDSYLVAQGCNDMDIDTDGNIYITGRFNMGPISFGEHELLPASPVNGNSVIFVASYNSNGEALWAQMAGDEEHTTPGPDFDEGKGLSIDANDNCYLTGTFSGSIIFGEDTLTSKGGPDAFMVKVSGSGSTGVEEIEIQYRSNKIALAQNYPNPFSESTTISYSLLTPGLVTLSVYDLLGNMAIELFNENQAAGEYSIKADLKSLSAGVYFYQLRSGAEQHTKKMIIR